MNVKGFLDTNVLVYAAAGSGRDAAKRRTALDLIDRVYFGTSAQVLQEFFVTVTRKIAEPLSASDAMEWVETLIEFPCLAVDHQLVRIAIEKSARYQISYWDAAVVAAAEALEADTIYSEDLNDGQLYGSVRVINPFKNALRS